MEKITWQNCVVLAKSQSHRHASNCVQFLQKVKVKVQKKSNRTSRKKKIITLRLHHPCLVGVPLVSQVVAAT